MFKAIGVGAKPDGTKFAVTVSYVDDRVTPNIPVASIVHVVTDKPALAAAVQAQLISLRDSDKFGQLNLDVQGKVLGTI